MILIREYIVIRKLSVMCTISYVFEFPNMLENLKFVLGSSTKYVGLNVRDELKHKTVFF